MITVYIAPGGNCPKCEELFTWMEDNIIGTIYRSIGANEITEMRINGVFTMEAPVMQVGENWYTVKELFDKNGLKKNYLREIFGMDH